MAFTLSTIYKAQDKFSGPLAAMERANAKFAVSQTKALGAVKASFIDVRNRLIGLAGNLSTAALMMTGFNAVKDFDESLASLRAITGLTGKAFIPFKQEIKAIGDALIITYPEVAKAMELIGSLKPELLSNAQAMGQMTKASILLSRASGADLATSASRLSGIMNIYGANASEAQKYVDILSTSEQKGTARVEELSNGLAKAGSIAKVLGMNLDETTAYLQAFAAGNISAEIAGTSLKAILNKLGTGANKNFNPAIVGSAKALDNLAKANIDLKKAQELVSPEMAGMLLTLIDQNKVVQELSGNQYNLGNAQKQADARAQSFTFRVEQLTAKFKNLAITGNESSGMLNVLGSILGFITNHLGAILTIIGTSIAVYGSYYAIMTAIRLGMIAWNVVTGISLGLQGAYPIAMKANTIAIAAFNATSKVAAAMTWLFNAALLANPMVWIVIGVMALIAGIILLVKNWDAVSAAMGKFFKWAWDGIKKFARYILDYMLFPVTLVLKAIEKLTGAKWATDALAGIEKLKDKVSDDNDPKSEAVKPVNTVKAANDVQIQRNEEISKNNLNIMLQNKSDQNVNITKNTAAIPVTTNTF